MSRESHLAAAWRVNRTYPLLLAGFLALNIALFLFLWVEIYPQEEHAGRSLIEMQQAARQGAKTLSPQQAYEQGKKDYQRFRAAIPESRHFADLVGDLYELAGKCNLEISQIGYDSKELAEEELLSTTLRFSVTGTYSELKRFIHGLEQSRRIFVIEDLTLNSAVNQDQERLVALNLRLTTYFRRGGDQ